MDHATERMVRHLCNPPPGSKAFAARARGMDLGLLIENLQLSVTERLVKGADAGSFLKKLFKVGVKVEPVDVLPELEVLLEAQNAAQR